VKKTLTAALGGKATIGFTIKDPDTDLAKLEKAGLSIRSYLTALEVMELTVANVAQLLEVPRSQLDVRVRPLKASRPGMPRKERDPSELMLKPGEETARFLRLLQIHAYEAKHRRREGLSADGIAREVILEVQPELGARGLELARTKAGLEKFIGWSTSRGFVNYGPGTIKKLPGSDAWYPVAIQPWQRKKKKREP
jgi:hypothetical protein